MADEIRKDVIVDVKIDGADSEKQVTTLTKRITELRTKNTELTKANKELEKSGQANTKEYIENAKQIEINKQKINENSASRKSLIQTLVAEDNSIKALQARNRELVKQRNEISTATAEGRAQIAILNQEINKNNETIRANVSQLEKQKINIGNYASALDGVIPGLGAFVQGTQAMTTASRTFIATPIGAIIGALGFALGALIAYFKGSEEGQDRLNKIMQVGSAIMGKVMDIVRDLGESLFNAASNPKKAFEDLVGFLKDQVVNRLTAIAVIAEGIINLDFKQVTNGVLQMATGMVDVVGRAESLYDELSALADLAIKEGNEVARLQREIRNDERAFKLEEAETAQRVAKLKQEAAFLEGDAKRKVIEEAIALEQKLSDREVALFQKKLKLAEEEDAIADNTIEDNNRLVEAQVALIQAETRRYENTLRLNKQLATAMEEDYTLRLERHQAWLDAEHEQYLLEKEKRDEAREQEEEITRNFNERIARETENRLKRETLERKKQYDADVRNKKRANDDKIAAEAKFHSVVARMLGDASSLFREHTIAYRTLAVAEATFNTMVGFTRALKAYDPPMNFIMAGLTLASGFKAIYDINKVKFGLGGLVSSFASGGRADKSGTFQGPLHSGGGIDYIRADGKHRINVEGGENFYVLKRTASAEINQLSALNQVHGGRSFASGGIVDSTAQGGFAGSFETNAAFRQARRENQNQQVADRVVLILQDFEAAQAAKNSPILQAQVL